MIVLFASLALLSLGAALCCIYFANKFDSELTGWAAWIFIVLFGLISYGCWNLIVHEECKGEQTCSLNIMK